MENLVRLLSLPEFQAALQEAGIGHQIAPLGNPVNIAPQRATTTVTTPQHSCTNSSSLLRTAMTTAPQLTNTIPSNQRTPISTALQLTNTICSNQRTPINTALQLTNTICSNQRTPISRLTPKFSPSLLSRSGTKKVEKFEKEVIYYNAAHHDRRTALSPNEKGVFKDLGLLQMFVEFNRQMSEQEIRSTVGTVYQLDPDSLIFFTSYGKHLSPLNLPDGCPLNGDRLYTIYTKKSIYVKCIFNEASTSSSAIMDNSDSSNSDDSIFVPKKKKKLSNSNEVSILFNEDRGNYRYIDEIGHAHDLVDVSVIELDSDTQAAGENPSNTDKSLPLSEILLKHQCKRRSTLRVNVSRATVYEDFLAVVRASQSGLSPLQRVNVTFTNECGIDAGGLTQEFFRLLLIAIKDDPYIFTGDDFSKTLNLSLTNLRSSTYELVGRIFQLVLINDGPSPQFLSPILYHLLTHDGDATDLNLDVTCISNHHVRTEIENLVAAENPGAFNSLMATSSFVSSCGTLHCAASDAFDTTKKIIIEDAIHEFAVERIMRPLKQLQNGLNAETHFLSDIKKNPDEFKHLFCFSGKELTAREVKNLFKATGGFGLRQKQALVHFEKFLNDIEGGNSSFSLKDIISFALARDTLPPMGFSPTTQPKIGFCDGCLPKAQTCFNKLILPLDNISYDEFKTMFEMALTSIEFALI